LVWHELRLASPPSLAAPRSGIPVGLGGGGQPPSPMNSCETPAHGHAAGRHVVHSAFVAPALRWRTPRTPHLYACSVYPPLTRGPQQRVAVICAICCCCCCCSAASPVPPLQRGGLHSGLIAPSAVEGWAAVAELAKPLQVPLPAMLAHRVGRCVALTAPGEAAKVVRFAVRVVRR